MTIALTQSTAVTFRIGPFVDETDGFTAEPGLTINQADIQISKAGGAFAQTSDASPTTTHDADGWYQCPLTATDTNTLGSLTVQILISGARPVHRDLMVVPDSQGAGVGREVYIGLLEQSTAREIMVGPFISTSTLIPLTAMTVGNITCGVLKDGSPPTNTAVTLTASGGNNDIVHVANGMWRCELTAGNTDTVGPWAVTYQDDDVFEGPVVYRGNVVPSNVYDSLIGGTDVLDVSLTQVLGTAVTESTATAGVLDVNVAEISDGATAANALQAAIDVPNGLIYADVSAISTSTTAANNLETATTGGSYNVGGGGVEVDVQKIDGVAENATNLAAMMNASPVYTVDDTAFSPTTTAFETDCTEATADHYVGLRSIMFVTGANAEAQQAITVYALSGGRGKFTTNAFKDAPANGDTFVLV